MIQLTDDQKLAAAKRKEAATLLKKKNSFKPVKTPINEIYQSPSSVTNMTTPTSPLTSISSDSIESISNSSKSPTEQNEANNSKQDNSEPVSTAVSKLSTSLKPISKKRSNPSKALYIMISYNSQCDTYNARILEEENQQLSSQRKDTDVFRKKASAISEEFSSSSVCR